MTSASGSIPPVRGQVGDTGLSHDIPFIRDLGVRLIHARQGDVQMRLELAERHMNASDIGHGGVVMSLLDVSMATSAHNMLSEEELKTKGSTTVEMKTSFIQPATGVLTCSARCVHRTGTVAFCDAEIRDAQNRLVATGSGTFKYIKRR